MIFRAHLVSRALRRLESSAVPLVIPGPLNAAWVTCGKGGKHDGRRELGSSRSSDLVAVSHPRPPPTSSWHALDGVETAVPGCRSSHRLRSVAPQPTQSLPHPLGPTVRRQGNRSIQDWTCGSNLLILLQFSSVSPLAPYLP